MNKQYETYLKSDDWAQLKIDLFNLRGRKCEMCGSKKSICVHHLTYKNIYKEEPGDLIILCSLCHSKEHKLIKTKKVQIIKYSTRIKQKNKKKRKNESKYITCCGYRWKKPE